MGRELDRYYLLGFDPTGNGRFIVAHGNPDRTPNIATFVPGAASGLNESGRALERGDNLYDAATRAGAEPGSTAVITWLGYDSPGLGEAFGSYAPAQAAAPALTQFQQGLTVARGGLDANTTLVGHSYGARVIGTAASATPGLADQVVAAGALDFGVNPSGRMIQSTAELHLPQDKVWVVEHRLDAAADATTPVVPDAGGYGVVEDVGAPGGDPSRPEFGASVVGAEPGPYRDSYVGLGGYATEPFSDAHGNMFDPDPGHRAGLDRMGGVIVNGRAE
nr:alpha/beta hydrolase [Kribbella sandramycini]